MSLRPRYSLLTLLILTALIAGGVKLWYGPHHVVEWVKPDEEVEYTYTRDWRGDRIIQGPYVKREFDKNGQLWNIEVQYYRQGINTNWTHHAMVTTSDVFLDAFPFRNGPMMSFPLSETEAQEFRVVVENVRPRIKPGQKLLIEDYGYYDSPSRRP